MIFPAVLEFISCSLSGVRFTALVEEGLTCFGRDLLFVEGFAAEQSSVHQKVTEHEERRSNERLLVSDSVPRSVSRGPAINSHYIKT